MFTEPVSRVFFPILLIVVSIYGFKLLAKNIEYEEKVFTDMGAVGDFLRDYIPNKDLKPEVRDVGKFVDTVYLNTSILEPVLTQVKTTKGVFVVYGQVSALQGKDVSVVGLNHDLFDNELCISNTCYRLYSAPSL